MKRVVDWWRGLRRVDEDLEGEEEGGGGEEGGGRREETVRAMRPGARVARVSPVEFNPDGVDPSAVLSPDMLVHIFLFLPSASDVLACAGVNRRFREFVKRKNVFGLWSSCTLPYILTKRALFVACDSRKLDPLLDPPPTSVDSYDHYLPLLFNARELSMEDAVKQLNDSGASFEWRELSLKGKHPPQHVTVYLGRGEWPALQLFASRLPKELKSLSVVGVDRSGVVISNQSQTSNSVTFQGAEFWSSVSLPNQNRFASCYPSRVTDWFNFTLRNCTITQTWRDAPESLTHDARKYFVVRVHQPGVNFCLSNCHVYGGMLSGVLLDRGATGLIQNCTIEKNQENGIFFYEAEGSAIGNKIVDNASAAVSVCCYAFGEGSFTIQRNECVVGSRDHNGIILRTREKPCALQMRVLDNTVSLAWTGISVWPQKKRDDPPLAFCEQTPDHICKGCTIEVLGNTIPNPKSHGIYVDSPLCPLINNHTCRVEGNVVSSTRHLAILVANPEDPMSSGVKIGPNELIETGESRPPFPGLQGCYDAGQCSRNCTGKRFELQKWYRCDECNFSSDNNLGCCMSCALVCHAGHKGLILYSYGVGAFCDCPDRKQRCAIFDHDPPLKEENDLT